MGQIFVAFSEYLNFIIQDLEFWKLLSIHICVSFSREKKSERLERKFKTRNSNLSLRFLTSLSAQNPSNLPPVPFSNLL